MGTKCSEIPVLLQSGRCASLLLGTDVIPASLPRLDQGLDIDATQVQRLLNQESLKGKNLLAPTPSPWPRQSYATLSDVSVLPVLPLRTSRGHVLFG